ncbi:hypothetical protein LCGC14_2469780 [marine sediment metagenome]|uniref:Uncharacterized protein n=1 Tax=marine sediment metagenome TaxID=412755 RepID=A0A0F9BBD1_9ZZZZ
MSLEVDLDEIGFEGAFEINDRPAIPGSVIVGGPGSRPRQEADFYSTPWECTQALIDAEKGVLDIDRGIWEPACGNGAMSRILENAGFTVRSTDLHNKGYGEGEQDFLETTEALAPCIITNPPFSLSARFISHALATLKVQYLALILKSIYWHAAKRIPLIETHPPSRIFPMGWRPDFDGRGAATMDLLWCVWDTNSYGFEYRPLRKPHRKS